MKAAVPAAYPSAIAEQKLPTPVDFATEPIDLQGSRIDLNARQ
jgi:hypothetical protein